MFCSVLFFITVLLFLRFTDLGPKDSVTMGIEEQFILLSLGLVTIGVRMGVRIRQIGFGGWQLDDYLMPFTGASGAITRICTGPFADPVSCSLSSLQKQLLRISSVPSSRA